MAQVLVVNAVRSRHTVIFWFGNCSYTKLKVTYEVRKMLCPLCLHPLEDGVYSGSKIFAKHRHARESVRGSWMPLVEDGVVVWSVVSDEGRKPYMRYT